MSFAAAGRGAGNAGEAVGDALGQAGRQGTPGDVAQNTGGALQLGLKDVVKPTVMPKGADDALGAAGDAAGGISKNTDNVAGTAAETTAIAQKKLSASEAISKSGNLVKKNRKVIAATAGGALVITAASLITSDSENRPKRDACIADCTDANTQLQFQEHCGSHFPTKDSNGVIVTSHEIELANCCSNYCDKQFPVYADKVFDSLTQAGASLLETGLGNIGWIAKNIFDILIFGMLLLPILLLLYVAGGGSLESSKSSGGGMAAGPMYYPPPPPPMYYAPPQSYYPPAPLPPRS